MLEHIEEAGVHSGDSACSLPAFSLRPETIEELERQTRSLARALGVCGLMNVQFAIEEPLSQSPRIFVLEVNPRASRTVPFVAKTIGVPLAAIAAKIMAGCSLESFGLVQAPYFARNHWVALETEDALTAAEIQRLVRGSYGLVLQKLPRKVRASMSGKIRIGRKTHA